MKAGAALAGQTIEEYIKSVLDEATHLLTVQPWYADHKEEKDLKKTDD